MKNFFQGENTALKEENERLRQQMTELEERLAAAEAARDQLATERHALYQAFTQIPILLAVLRGPEHTYEMMSTLLLQALNKTAEQVVGNPVRTVFANEQHVLDVTIPAFEHVRSTGETMMLEELLVQYDRDGDGESEDVWIKAVYQPVFKPDTSVDGIIFMGFEITQQIESRRQLEARHTENERLNAELRDAQARQQAILDNAAVGVSVVDAQGRFIEVNQRWLKLLGYSEADMLGKTSADITHPDDRAASREQLRALVRGEIDSYTLEKRYITKDGNVFWAELSVTPIRNAQDKNTPDYFIGVIADITERKRQTEELNLARFTLDSVSIGIQWIDPHGKQVYANDALCDALGYTREEMLTMSIPDIDPNFQMETWDGMWNEIRQNGITFFETVHRRKDGTTMPVEIAANYLHFNERRYICAFVRDVTERQQAEAERATLQQQVIDAQQVALRELSTPLIPLTEKVLIMPLIGTIDSARAQLVMETLLEGVAERHAELVILDITGVSVVDTQVANAFIHAAQAVRLLGADVMMTGIQPPMAQTMVQLGLDLGSIITRGSLQAGIASALQNR